MFCPKCKREYTIGIDTCPNCGEPLSGGYHNGGIDDHGREYVELVTIMETSDRALIAFIKSIFEDAHIRYFIKGESLLGLGRTALAVEIQVAEDDVKAARELLKDI